MFAVMIRSKGKPWLFCLRRSLYSSALIASSPRTAYSTLSKAGFKSDRERGDMVGLVECDLRL